MVIASKSLIWSPHGQNQFLCGGTELKLYEWIPKTEDSPGRVRYLSTIPEITLMMCADWSPDPQCPDLVAVGLTTGRTLLVRMQEHAMSDYPNLENVRAPNKYPSLGVKMSRTSNVVSFSKTHPHLLSVGLDKVRNEPCLFVWDVSRSMESYLPSGAQTPVVATFKEANRSKLTDTSRIDFFEDRPRTNEIPGLMQRESGPIRQYGSSEVISSCAWTENANMPLLMTGMANKYLRVYDIRTENTNPLQFSTKAVYGTTPDPFQPYRLASYTEEGVIKVWDLRKHTEAVLSLQPESKGSLSKIVFSPQSSGLLASLSKDTHHMQLWNIQETRGGLPVLWKTKKTRSSTRPFGSFTFIPKNLKDPHLLLGVHTDGSFESIQVEEASPMTWEPTGGMVMTNRSGLIACQPASLKSKMQRLQLKETVSPSSVLSSQLEKDISVVMRKRLLEGYSMNAEKNLRIIHQDRALRELWTWIQIAEKMAPKLSKVGNLDYSFHGVYGIWVGSQSRHKSSPANTPRLTSSPKISRESSTQSLKDSLDEGDMPMVQTNKLLQRNVALFACGLAFDAEGFEKELVSLETLGDYDKAAALALFHGNLDRAIKSLSQSKDEHLKQRKLISAILASYKAGTSNTWKEICESLCEDMVDRPYLKAIFAYIASDDWYRVLDEPGLPLRERMAIALRILDDEQMTAYLNKTVDKAIEEGDVEGIVVTGLTLKGIDILEKALDKYGDVQTASLIMSFIVPKRFKDNRVEDWVENYRLLMDRWQLWHERARFDIERGKRMNSSEIAPPQVYVRCNYCAQSLGHSLVIQNARNREGKRMNVQTSNPSGRVSSKQKSTVCSSCRKPLPRCALCLLQMGTPVDQLRQNIMANDTYNNDPAGFDLWFTWCQSCRHGGHAIHMFDWFQKHTTCPVSNCSCQCQI
ncbi:WD40-repeat-containing domain protein [Sporodiniella umbellata]|nr:WD40-repeat-containing domain protein [Sporodiniella umbellata]